ncbi:MAG: fibro-slime domain-containing protein, partial [Vicinamibacteria bacterium]|nr:fibro-slime domain-containing protein [Vicinamibacteria bacterium]
MKNSAAYISRIPGVFALAFCALFLCGGSAPAFASTPPIITLSGGPSYSAYYGLEVVFDVTATTVNPGAVISTISSSPLPQGSSLAPITGAPSPSFSARFKWTSPLFANSVSICFTTTDSVGAAAATNCANINIQFSPLLQVSGTLRDFTPSHPDFARAPGDAGASVAAPVLGFGRKPVYAPSGPLTTITNGTTFAEWWNNGPSSTAATLDLTLTNALQTDSRSFTYESSAFQPLTSSGVPSTPPNVPHSAYFTFESHGQAPYLPGQILRFKSADDLWVFINGQLVLEMAGVHSSTTQTVDLDARAAALALVANETFRLDLFYAHRGLGDAALTIQVPQGFTSYTPSGADLYPGLPTLANPLASPVGATTATIGAEVVSPGDAGSFERGVIYSPTGTNANPLLGGLGVIRVPVAGTTGAFSSGLTGLAPGTGYAWKAYAQNGLGVTYVPVQAFTTATCPAITLGSLSDTRVNLAYTGSAAASGGSAPYSYDVTAGSLPPGLTLTPSGLAAGALSGSSTAVGSYPFTITATDAAGCAGSRSYTLVVGSTVTAGSLVIREFRLRGSSPANSATDEYIVLHNTTAADITVASTDSAGFAVASSDATVVFTIPNGAVIPARGHFLGANSVGFSLGVAPDATWTTDIADSLGLALFDSTNLGGAAVLDAVGVGTSAAPFAEGTQLASLSTPGEYAWVRKATGTGVQDTGSSSLDFVLVSTTGAIFDGVQSILGAPAPGNNGVADAMSRVSITLIEP